MRTTPLVKGQMRAVLESLRDRGPQVVALVVRRPPNTRTVSFGDTMIGLPREVWRRFADSDLIAKTVDGRYQITSKGLAALPRPRGRKQ